jgi:hypothetical protein
MYPDNEFSTPPLFSPVVSPSPSPLTPPEDAPFSDAPRAALPIRAVCRIVGHVTSEMAALVSTRVQLHSNRRRLLCHVRQIAMYVCHVALRIPLQDIGQAFGRDRTTVGHACHVVEDRRDDAAFDDFVGTIERIVTSVFSAAEITGRD